MNINDTLIEAIFEIRWGHVTPNKIEINQAEQSVFMSQFSVEMANSGFVFTESPNSNNFPVMMPHVVQTRYRSEANVWPCYQTGTGILTVNLVRPYSTTEFNRAISCGVKAFFNASRHNLEKIIPTAVLVMRYQNLVERDEKEDVASGVQNKFGITFALDSQLPTLGNNKLTELNLAFSMLDEETNTNTNVSIRNVYKDSQPAYFLETTSVLKLDEVVDMDKINTWSSNTIDYQEKLYMELLSRG